MSELINVDLVNHSGGQGELANDLVGGQLNIGRMRPYIDAKGRT